MSYARFGDAMAAIARAEVERRLRTFPAYVAKHPDKLEDATVNFHAWHAIADYLERGYSRLINCYGGAADPPSTWIDWTTIVAAADKELEALDVKLAARARDRRCFAGGADTLTDDDHALQLQRDRILCIAVAVRNRRDLLEETTGELRASIAGETELAA